MADKKEKVLSECEQCRYKMEMAHSAHAFISKLLERKDNVWGVH